MKPAGFWLGCLAMAGSCLLVVGCGGGDVPDPDSDASAAVETGPKVVSQGGGGGEAAAEPAPTPAAEPAPTAAAAPTEPQRQPESVAATAPAATEPPAETAKPVAEPTPVADAAPSAGDTATASKNDSSATEEMLRMAAAPPPPAAETSTSAAPAPGAAASGGAAAPGVMGMAGNKGGAPPAVGAAGAPEPMSGRIGPGGDGPDAMTARNGGRPGGGQFGGANGPGGSANEPPLDPRAFQNPGSAVQAFLDALKAKNKDRLSQATARRSVTEAVEKHRKTFAAILEQSISDEELEDMAKVLDGFRLQSVLPAKSTSLIGVVISKNSNFEMLQRTVQVRHEKEGWKVMDFGDTIALKSFNPNSFRRKR